jgi:hypothetical protein
LPISAVDAIDPAFEHTKRQLLKPFRINQWAKLALVGFLAGEISSGSGSFRMPSLPSVPHMPRNTEDSPFGGLSGIHWPHIDPKTIALLITIAVVSVLLLWILFTYLNSMMRFVLFDSVLEKECNIRQSWRRRHEAGMRLFFWQIGLAMIALASMLVFLGIPSLIAFAMGWLTNPGDHVLPLVFGGILIFLILFPLWVGFLVVMVLTKDFVVPQMALENISAVEGWRRLLRMMKSEKSSYAAYVGMKIVLALGAAIMFGIITLIAIVLMMIPAAVIGIVVVLAGKAAGLTWTLYTITWGIVAVCIGFLIMLYVVSFVSVPGIVFFPAYSLHFFASRYPALNALLNPPPPVPPLPPAPPAFFPPPEPIG